MTSATKKKERRNMYVIAGAIGAIVLLTFGIVSSNGQVVLGKANGFQLGVSFKPSTFPASITYNGVDVTTKSMVLTLSGAIATSGGVSVTSWSISGNLVIITDSKTFSTVTLAASGTGTPPASIPVSLNASNPLIIPMSKFQTFWGFTYGTKTISFTGNPTLTVHFSDGTTQTPVYSNLNLGSITMNYSSSATAVLTLNPVGVTTQMIAWLSKLR